LNVAVRDGVLERNPFAKVALPAIEAGRTRFLSPDEEARLLKALGPYASWARLAILTGMRQSEQFNAKWTDLYLDLGILTLPATKAGEVQYVHLNQEAKDILETMKALAEADAIDDPTTRSPWIFPSEKRSTPIDPRNFYVRVYVPAVDAAGLTGVNWHCLRHTYASRLAMNGASESTIAALLRHSGTELVSRYAHLSPSHLHAAVEGVARFGNGTVTETGIMDGKRITNGLELVEKFGAGDGI
jgi:integrase